MKPSTPLAALTLAALLVGPAPVHAQATDSKAEESKAADAEPELTLEERREQARIDKLWSINWRDFARYYIEHEGKYICVPGYAKSLPSSKGQTTRDYIKESVWLQEYTDERGDEQKRKLVKPDEEADAAVRALPEVAPGQYGYIHSGLIESIEDDKSLSLKEVWLVDSDAVEEAKAERMEEVFKSLAEDIEKALRDGWRKEKRNRGDGILRRRAAEKDAVDWAFKDREDAARRQRDRAFSRTTWKVVGYRTDNLTADARWPAGAAADRGLQLVIVAVEDRTITAVPAATIGNGLKEYDFFKMLLDRGVNKAQFVEMLTEARRTSRDDYVQIVLAQLEGDTPVQVDDPNQGLNDEVQLAD